MPAHPRHGVITIAALDLRRRPDHRSELTSQLLLGEVVRVLGVSKDSRWWHVENGEDRYRGWIRCWGVAGATRAQAAAWETQARGRVRVSYAELRSERAGGWLVTPLFWRSRLIVGASRLHMRPARLPDGRRGWVDAAAISVGGRARASMAERIQDLLGVPYLWGGRTPLGLDCSAFSQLVLAEQGIRLPRDADEQYRACDPLPDGESPKLGDLVFFGSGRGRLGHVGLALGNGAYAHARGWVRVNSLVRDNPLYDSDLHSQLRAVGRPGRRAGWSVKEGQKPQDVA